MQDPNNDLTPVSSETPAWQDDLFGGRDKVYGSNGERISQDSNQRATGGEYPHQTFDGTNWHTSTAGGAAGEHTQLTNYGDD